jgi:hypothetical protein
MPEQQSKNPGRREFLRVATGNCAGACMLLAGTGLSSCLHLQKETKTSQAAKRKSILPANGDFSMVAYCCLKCNECDAYIATKSNNQELKEEVARRWHMQPEQINCYGCKTPSALFNCAAKQCAVQKKVITCAHCDEFPTCTIETWTKWPKLREQVAEMREALQA